MLYREIMSIQLMTVQKETPHWDAQDSDKEVWSKVTHDDYFLSILHI